MASRRTKRVLQILSVLVAVGLLLGWPLLEIARMASRYGAKIAGSAWHVCGRDGEEVLARGDLTAIAWLPGLGIRHDDARTEVQVLWGLTGSATHRPGLGVTLVGGEGSTAPDAVLAEPTPGQPWPEAGLPASIKSALDAVVAQAFPEPASRPGLRPRAVLVAHRGELVAERYGDGFDRDTRQLGWSMAKSVVHALVGAAIQKGVLGSGDGGSPDVGAALADSLPWPAWEEGDARHGITWDHALHMVTGLSFQEVYSVPWGEAAHMLFAADDMAAYAGGMAAAHDPGTHWAYSSGTTNLICGALKRCFRSPQEALAFPREALFSPLGMASAVWETDRAQTFIGSSFLYATPRDWLRLGQLYLQDGIWQGERILPQGWAEHARSPAAGARFYGAHWWLNREGPGGEPARMPGCPDSAFMAMGHNGQALVVLPDQELVVLRMGWSDDSAMVDLDGLVGGVIEVLAK